MHATLRILAKEYYARIKNINTDFNIKNCLLVPVGADWTDNTKRPYLFQRKYLAKCYRELYEWMKSQEDETEA